MPTEILLHITDYLPASSLMSLNYLCRKIRQQLGISIEEVLGQKERPLRLSGWRLTSYYMHRSVQRLEPILGREFIDTTWRSPTLRMLSPVSIYYHARLDLLCMLNRDNLIPAKKSVCSGYADTHRHPLFSKQSLEQSSYVRLCFGSIGRVWICPHWTIDYSRTVVTAELRKSHFCGRNGPYVPDDYFRGPSITWVIVYVDGNILPTDA